MNSTRTSGREFIHTDSTVTPRSSDEIPALDDMPITIEFEVWPNPVTSQSVDISLENADTDKEYVLAVYDAIGTLCSKIIVANDLTSISVTDSPGVYLICLLQGGELIQTKKVVRN